MYIEHRLDACYKQQDPLVSTWYFIHIEYVHLKYYKFLTNIIIIPTEFNKYVCLAYKMANFKLS